MSSSAATISSSVAKPTPTVPNVPHESLTPKVASLLRGYPSIIEVPVQWGEQDSFQHVNNVTYARWFESGRIAFFEHIFKPNMTSDAYANFMFAKAVGPIVKTIFLDYKFPVTYPDTIFVGVRVDSIPAPDRFNMNVRMVSKLHERKAVEGNAMIVMYDYRVGKKAEIPELLLELLKKDEGVEIKSSL
ncbi:hypothetical protein HK102_011795 [Quaeritorhiza haematococci]|nr:hypothetical protein HK102_011795 [Quaeritorhiza haematococci]